MLFRRLLLAGVLLASPAGTAYGDLTADPTALDYGVRRNNSFYDQVVTITAIGHESIESCTFVGPDGAEFSLQTACPPTLQDTSLPLTVRFAPTSVGDKSATLRISALPHGDLDVPLGATVPVLWMSPTDYSFGNTPIGTQDGPESFSVINDHDQTVTVTNIAEGAQAGCTEFSNSSVVNPVLASGMGTTFTITHQPTTIGFAFCEYTISNNAAAGTNTTISVSGTGVAPDITLDPASPYHFGFVPLSDSFSQDFSVGNSGNSGLDVTAITKAPTTDCIHFLLSNIGNVIIAPIPPGSSEPFTIDFTPMSWGSFTCEISIQSNDPDESPLALTVQGQGVTSTIFADGFE